MLLFAADPLTPSAAFAASAPYWVFFRDRGTAAEQGVARQRRLDDVTARARQRRLRAHPGVIVRASDLPPCARYQAAVEATGARVRTRSHWLNALSVSATPRQVARIASLPFVARVRRVAGRARPSGAVRDGDAAGRPVGLATQVAAAVDRQLALLQVPALWECGLTGRGVVVGVQDTGFLLSHRAFARLRVLAQRDFVQGDETTANQPGEPSGQHDHGTKVLSLLAGREPGVFSGVAPEVSVLLAKIDDVGLNTPIEDDWWVAGLEWLEQQGADLVTSSIGYCAGGGACLAQLKDGKTEPTTIAARAAIREGVVVVSSASNRGPGATSIEAPADGDGVIAVGAVTLAGEILGFSGRGPTFDQRIKPDVVAPGEGVVAADPAGGQYATVGGTSVAAPLVAGVVALLLQRYPSLGPAEVLARLTSTASRAATPDNDYGWGLVDGLRAAGGRCDCRAEECHDGVDTDCDGLADAVDPDCAPAVDAGPAAGDAGAGFPRDAEAGGCACRLRTAEGGGSIGGAWPWAAACALIRRGWRRRRRGR